MIALTTIDVINQFNTQDIEIAPQTQQDIVVENTTSNQEIDISTQDGAQDVEIIQTECNQGIDISIPCPAKVDLQIAIDSKVPKSLSILPQATDEQMSSGRADGKLYLDMEGKPCYVTLEQIKQLSTKTICVDELTDKRINALSNDDIVLLKER